MADKQCDAISVKLLVKRNKALWLDAITTYANPRQEKRRAVEPEPKVLGNDCVQVCFLKPATHRNASMWVRRACQKLLTKSAIPTVQAYTITYEQSAGIGEKQSAGIGEEQSAGTSLGGDICPSHSGGALAEASRRILLKVLSWGRSARPVLAVSYKETIGEGTFGIVKSGTIGDTCRTEDNQGHGRRKRCVHGGRLFRAVPAPPKHCDLLRRFL